MTVYYLEQDLAPVRFWGPEFPIRVDKHLKKTAARIHLDVNKLSCWRLIFLQSRANGCFYNVEDLPQTNWQWPKHTWFQERLGHQLKDSQDSQPRLEDEAWTPIIPR
jgi:hypothetical protein